MELCTVMANSATFYELIMLNKMESEIIVCLSRFLQHTWLITYTFTYHL